MTKYWQAANVMKVVRVNAIVMMTNHVTAHVVKNAPVINAHIIIQKKDVPIIIHSYSLMATVVRVD